MIAQRPDEDGESIHPRISLGGGGGGGGGEEKGEEYANEHLDFSQSGRRKTFIVACTRLFMSVGRSVGPTVITSCGIVWRAGGLWLGALLHLNDIQVYKSVFSSID